MDVYCRVCGEPWDYYGVKHGDMTPEEAERFLRGEGCPSCRFGEVCPSCKGTGKKRCDYCFSGCECCDGGFIPVEPCPRCGGTGKPQRRHDEEFVESLMDASDDADEVLNAIDSLL